MKMFTLFLYHPQAHEAVGCPSCFSGHVMQSQHIRQSTHGPPLDVQILQMQDAIFTCDF